MMYGGGVSLLHHPRARKKFRVADLGCSSTTFLAELFGPGHFVGLGLGLGLRLKSEIRTWTRART
jgi:hypothetical protein